jgi:hypothetical protein
VTPGGRARLFYRWAVVFYDRAYRWAHGLDRPHSEIGSAFCLEIRRSRRARELCGGTPIRRGERIGILHLNNERIAALHGNGLSPLAVGLEFRRRLIASLRTLAALAESGALKDVQAFAATTIFHQGLARLGFQPELGGPAWPRLVAAYQRALLASVHPAGPRRLRRTPYHRARRLWISRATLRERYRPAPGFKPAPGDA